MDFPSAAYIKPGSRKRDPAASIVLLGCSFIIHTDPSPSRIHEYDPGIQCFGRPSISAARNIPEKNHPLRLQSCDSRLADSPAEWHQPIFQTLQNPILDDSTYPKSSHSIPAVVAVVVVVVVVVHAPWMICQLHLAGPRLWCRP